MELPRDFGRYELLEKLGKGGMAHVFLGRQKATGMAVAVKILFENFAEEPHVAARFEREARTGAMMNDPNVGRVVDSGRHEGRSFIVFEFIDGMNLSEWIQTHGDPPLEIALLIMRDIARGLRHAHAAGRDIVHRDLKPHNIMLSKDGMVKLLDFGLARAMSEDTFKTRTEGLIAGTVPYMSPEQVAGWLPEGEAGKLSDIFSLGTVFYELLAGTRPFGSSPNADTAHAIQTQDPLPLEQENPLVPAEVVLMVHRMLQKAPQHRVPAVTQVVEVLEEALEQLQVRRDRALMQEYVADTVATAARLRKRSVDQYLQRGLHFKALGRAGVDDALQEFRRVVYLDRANPVAKEQLGEIESELRHRKEREERTGGGDVSITEVMPPATGTANVPAGAEAQRRIPVWQWVGALVLIAVAIAVGFQVQRRGRVVAAPSHGAVPAEPAPAESVTAPVQTAISPSVVVLDVSPPGAKVSVDRGVSGSSKRFEGLSPGDHRFVLRADGFDPLERVVRVVAGRETTLAFHLARQSSPTVPAALSPAAYGHLRVSSTTDYYGQIWIDGADTGRQTAALIKVPKGEHVVGLKHEGFSTTEGDQKVRLRGGDTLTVRFAVVRQP